MEVCRCCGTPFTREIVGGTVIQNASGKKFVILKSKGLHRCIMCGYEG